MAKPYLSGQVACMYGCRDCDFGGDAANGIGLAAQHAEANPDHAVWVEKTSSFKWNEGAWE